MFGFLKKVINPLSIVKPVAGKSDEATVVDEKDASSATSDDVKQVINADEKSKHPETVEDEVKKLHVLEEEPDKETAIEIGSDDVSKDNSDSLELEPDSFLEELTEDGPNSPSIAATQKNITDTTTDTVNANEVSAVESGVEESCLADESMDEEFWKPVVSPMKPSHVGTLQKNIPEEVHSDEISS